MARLESVAKAGFYPTPPEVVEMICSFLRGEEPVGRLLDPCCGNGFALAKIAHGLQGAKTYGIELDRNRAQAAKKVLTRAIRSDLFRARTKQSAYSLLFLNPPYDASGDETKRLEHKMLVETNVYLKPGGVLIYIIPQARVQKRTARYLATWYQKFLVYRFPDESYKAFGQIVLFAVKKAKATPDPDAYTRLLGVPTTKLKEIYKKEKAVYVMPKDTTGEKAFYLRSLDLDPEEAQKEVDEHGAWEQAEHLMYPPMEDVRGNVLMPLRKGHLAILIACGLCDGVLEKNGKRLLIKGVAKKEELVSTEKVGTTLIEKRTDIIKIGIKALDLETGELMNIE